MTVRLLYVEDDELLRLAMRRLLQHQYEVTVAKDGQEALELIQARDFDIVVTDIEMPRMGGLELHFMVAQLNPILASKFIFVSGGFDKATERRLRALPNRFLDKPYDHQTLQRAVQEVLA